MLPEYDFSTAIRNPYVKPRIRREVTIPIDSELYDYFEQKAEDVGVPVDRIINRCLDDVVIRLRNANKTDTVNA
ncbi:MAG: antitoxin [Oscillospiraceae bacterium]|jgi:hypothetical protein|nr:antitoxin [Oscillospiraceae bacterium]